MCSASGIGGFPLGSRSARGAQSRPGAGARTIASLFSSWLVLALSGCATPFLRPAVEVPAQFAASPATEAAPEVAWWEGFGDPVLSELVRRAAHENRDVRIAARAGTSCARRRDDQSFVAAAGHRRRRLRRERAAGSARCGFQRRCAVRRVGSRSRGSAARRRGCRRGRRNRHRKRGTRRPAARAERRRDASTSR